MEKDVVLTINNINYNAHITYKFMRSVRFRLEGDKFKISCPYGTSIKFLENCISKHTNSRIFKKSNEEPISDDYCYIFGEKQHISDGFCSFCGHFILFNKNNFYKDIKNYAVKYFAERVEFYKSKMGISIDHKISTRLVKSQFGCNYLKSKTISFDIYLIHFTKEIIDAIVVHELAHDFERNHSKSFYDIVYKYCPNYKKLHRALVLNHFNGEL